MINFEDQNIFSIGNFSVIQDENNFYFFRALEQGDIEDLELGKIRDEETTLSSIRTYRTRLEEKIQELGSRRLPQLRYTEDEEITLQQMWDHIRKNFYPGTNCISFSSNCNVCVDYGNSANINKYIMMSVPKTGDSSVYNAGEYMLREISKKIDEVIATLPEDSKILQKIREIEEQTEHKEIRKMIHGDIKSARTERNFRRAKVGETSSILPNVARFDDKQFFTPEQQLEYSKIIAKLTVLELHGKLSSIINTKPNNSSLVATVGMAYSSGEIIHYGEVDSSKFQKVSRTIVDMFALLQQAENQGLDKEKIEKIKLKILNYAKLNYDIQEKDGRIFFTNGEEEIELGSSEDSVLINEDSLNASSLIDIGDVYQMSEGRISYVKAKEAMQYAVNLAIAQQKTIELSNILKTIIDDPEYAEIIEEIQKSTVAINSSIISRKNNEGIQISESVNLDMNRGSRKIFTKEQQSEVINIVKNLDEKELFQIIETGTIPIQYLQQIIQENEKKEKNRYYAEAIVDSLNFDYIYRQSNGRRIVTDEEKERLIQQLEQADCEKLYMSFRKANIENDADISGYIINLLMNKGFQGMDFETLSRYEDLEELISKNTKNLKSRVQAIRLDKLFGIQDDAHVVEGTEIELRDYQQEAVDNVDKIHENSRFAGVILPTGAGKSFVAMAQMMKYRNSNIIYIAPNKEILHQIERHILDNILGKKGVPLSEGKKYLEEAFPNLKLRCYQGLPDAEVDKDMEYLRSLDARLIVLDEVHRAGAETWNSKVLNLIEANPEAKVLGITATPERDVDGKDMMKELAMAIDHYTPEQMREAGAREKYVATEMYLLDAIQEGIVISPKIVSFNYFSENSEEYLAVTKMIEEEKDEIKRQELIEIQQEMKKIIQNSELKGMTDIFSENIKKKDGRYIVFIPENSGDKDVQTYLQEQIERIKEFVLDIDEEPEIHVLHSQLNDKDNMKALTEFEESESDHLKLIVAVNKLNEGVHVRGINGEIMLRPIGAGSRILYLQQIGRCVYAIDPDKPVKGDDIPRIFDVVGNYRVQNMDIEANRTNPQSDLQRLQRIVMWYERHGYLPDINSEDENEARKAIALKRIQQKYGKYIEGINNKSLTENEIHEIEQILELGKILDLWNVQIPDRIIPPGEREIGRVNTFRVEGEEKEFLELFKKAKKLNNGRVSYGTSTRISNIMNVLNLLSDFGLEINNETVKIDSNLKSILANMEDGAVSTILSELDSLAIDESFNIGEEYNFIKQQYAENSRRAILFQPYEFSELKKCGIFNSYMNENFRRSIVDSNGFIEGGLKEYVGLHSITGTQFDEEGYDKKGYNEIRFNRAGFHRNGRRRDERGFDFQGLLEDGTARDERGFDVYGRLENGQYYDERGFNAYCKHRNGTMFDDEGYDFEGYTNIGFNKDRIHKNGTLRDERGFDYKGELEDGRARDERGFDVYGIHLNGTKRDDEGYDIWGYDKKGFDRNKIHKNGTLYDDHGKDADGYNKRGFNDKKMHKNGTEYDDDGLDFYGYDKEGYNKYGFNRNKIHRNGTLQNERGFDANGKTRIKGKGNKLFTRDERGFDIDALLEDGRARDERGFDAWGKLEDGRERDERGFDAWCKLEDGSIRDKRKFDAWGKLENGATRDRRGFDAWGKLEDGSPRDKRHFDAWGLLEDGEARDERRFDAWGKLENGATRDERGFDVWGLLEDGETRDKRHFDAWGLLEDGTTRDERGFDAWGKLEDGSTHDDAGYDAYNEYLFDKCPKATEFIDSNYSKRYFCIKNGHNIGIFNDFLDYAKTTNPVIRKTIKNAESRRISIQEEIAELCIDRARLKNLRANRDRNTQSLQSQCRNAFFRIAPSLKKASAEEYAEIIEFLKREKSDFEQDEHIKKEFDIFINQVSLELVAKAPETASIECLKNAITHLKYLEQNANPSEKATIIEKIKKLNGMLTRKILSERKREDEAATAERDKAKQEAQSAQKLKTEVEEHVSKITGEKKVDKKHDE